MQREKPLDQVQFQQITLENVQKKSKLQIKNKKLITLGDEGKDHKVILIIMCVFFCHPKQF